MTVIQVGEFMNSMPVEFLRHCYGRFGKYVANSLVEYSRGPEAEIVVSSLRRPTTSFVKLTKRWCCKMIFMQFCSWSCLSRVFFALNLDHLMNLLSPSGDEGPLQPHCICSRVGHLVDSNISVIVLQYCLIGCWYCRWLVINWTFWRSIYALRQTAIQGFLEKGHRFERMTRDFKKDSPPLGLQDSVILGCMVDMYQTGISPILLTEPGRRPASLRCWKWSLVCMPESIHQCILRREYMGTQMFVWITWHVTATDLACFCMHLFGMKTRLSFLQSLEFQAIQHPLAYCIITAWIIGIIIIMYHILV